MLLPEHEELLSAYLDGELSPGECSRAEQLLAEQPECRHFLDELLSLRHSLQSLPRHAAPAGFAQRVQAQIERSPAPPIATPAPSADESPRVTSTGQRWLRPLVWSSLAVAAALVIMALSPWQLEDGLNDGPVRVAWNEATESATDKLQTERAQGAAAATARSDADGAIGSAQGGAGHKPAADSPAVELLVESEQPKEETGAPSAPAPLGLANDSSAAGALATSDATAPLLLVQCDLTPEAAQQDAFRQLLSQARIAWDSMPLETDLMLTDERPAQVERYAEAEQRTPATAPTPPATDAAPDTVAASPEGPLELVLVEAPPEQLEAMLAQLNSQAREFPAVVVTPAADDQTQANWLQYNRAATPPTDTDSAERAARSGLNLRLRKSRARSLPPADAAPSTAGAPPADEANAPALEQDTAPPLSTPPTAAAEAAAPPTEDAAPAATAETSNHEVPSQDAPNQETLPSANDELTTDQRALQYFMTQNSANFSAALRRRTERQLAEEQAAAQPRAQRIVLPEGRSINELLQFSQSNAPASTPAASPGASRRDAAVHQPALSTDPTALPAARRGAGNRLAESAPQLQQAIFLLRVVPPSPPAAP